MNRYLVVNFDRKEYLRPEAFGEASDLDAVVKSYEGVLLGLTILLSDSNGRGGGDLRAEHDLIGSWAGNRIALIDDEVTHPAFSEPGMEATALQRQMLALGKDLSRDVMQIIVDAEGEYCTLSQLNERSLVPLVEQRKLSEAARKLLLKADGRKIRLRSLEQPFEVLGVTMGLTPQSARARFQEGIDKMAVLFAAVRRPQVLRVSYEHGPKAVPDHRNGTKTKIGVTRLTLDVQDLTGNSDPAQTQPLTASRQVVIHLGANGTTTEELFEQLLGVTQFERPPAVEGITSPEVAKLLSMIPNLGA